MTVAIWLLTSCCCCQIGVELHSKQSFGSSFSFLSFTTFIFASLLLLVQHPQFLWQRSVPIRVYLFITVIFFLVSVANNRILSFRLPFPLIIIYRSGTLVANVILTWLLQNRTFSLGRIFSVSLVTVGIVLFTLNSQNEAYQQDPHTTDYDSSSLNDTFHFVLGIIVLCATLFASAYLGIVQENVFHEYGKHPEEMMFYVHALSLPLFIFVASEIKSDFMHYSQSAPMDFYFATLSTHFVSLAAIIILQMACIRSVYWLASEASSLQVTMILTLRKFLNILFSVLIFKNEFGLYHSIATFFVLFGSFTFYDGFGKCWHSVRTTRLFRRFISKPTDKVS